MNSRSEGKRAAVYMFAIAALCFLCSYLFGSELLALVACGFLLGGLSKSVMKEFTEIFRDAERLQDDIGSTAQNLQAPEAEREEANQRREAEGLVREQRYRAEELAREKRFQAEELASRRRYEAEQEGICFWIKKYVQDGLDGFLVLPERLQAAEVLLDQAESQFSDGAFAPFWDSIESAANELGKFKDEVTDLKENLALYRSMAEKYERTPPSFPVSREAMEKLTLSTGTVQRLQAVVGRAQRDFQFSVIFEQRKTNQLLVAGFRDLADGLRQIGSQVELSTESLVRCMDGLNAGLFEINEGVWEVAAEVVNVKEAVQDVGEGVGDLKDEVSRGFRTVEARQFAAIRILDNIQRRRRPGIFEPSPR